MLSMSPQKAVRGTSNDIKEIKSENRDFREDISALRERVAKVESSLKSYHKRLDGEIHPEE